MKKLSIILLVLSAMLLISCSSIGFKSNSNPVLKVEGGKVIGVETPTKGIIAYKGVPFAAPPVGDLRWREPQPVVPWEGVKIADKYGAASMQKHGIRIVFTVGNGEPAALFRSEKIVSI